MPGKSSGRSGHLSSGLHDWSLSPPQIAQCCHCGHCGRPPAATIRWMIRGMGAADMKTVEEISRLLTPAALVLSLAHASLFEIWWSLRNVWEKNSRYVLKSSGLMERKGIVKMIFHEQDAIASKPVIEFTTFVIVFINLGRCIELVKLNDCFFKSNSHYHFLFLSRHPKVLNLCYFS